VWFQQLRRFDGASFFPRKATRRQPTRRTTERARRVARRVFAMASHASASMREPAALAPEVSVDVNATMRARYRGRRCPRWRVRDSDASGSASGGRGTRKGKGARKGHAKTLLIDADGGEPFEKVNETKDGIVVWMRASCDARCSVKEVMAETRFAKCTARRFWRAVSDVERYAEFVPFVKTSRVVKKEIGIRLVRDVGANRGAETPEDGSSATSERVADRVWAYNVVKPPVASARDYCIRITVPSADDPAFVSNETSFRSSWVVDSTEAPPAKRGVVRLAQNRGSWRVADDGGGGCLVTYRVFTDPGASVPGWLIDVANKTSVPDVLRAFHKRAVCGLYDEEDAASSANLAAARDAASRRVSSSSSFGFDGTAISANELARRVLELARARLRNPNESGHGFVGRRPLVARAPIAEVAARL